MVFSVFAALNSHYYSFRIEIPRQSLIWFLSLLICLFWTLPINRIIQYVEFRDGLFLLVFKVYPCCIMYQYFFPFYGWVIEDSWESLGLQGDPTSPFWRSALVVLWKEWCWSWNSSTLAISCEELIIGKDSDAGRDWGQEEKGTTEDEIAGWHHWLDGSESQWTPGVGDGQGGLECCDSWGHKESDTTEQLNWTKLNNK